MLGQPRRAARCVFEASGADLINHCCNCSAALLTAAIHVAIHVNCNCKLTLTLLQNGLYIIDTASGQGDFLALNIPLLDETTMNSQRAAFMRARVQVALVSSLAHLGVLLLHVVGGTDLFYIYYLDGEWHAKHVQLGDEMAVNTVRAVTSTKLILESTGAGLEFSCVLSASGGGIGAPQGGAGDAVLAIHLATTATVIALAVEQHEESDQVSLSVEPAMPTPALITAAFSDEAGSVTGWTNSIGGSNAIMGGYTTGLHGPSSPSLLSEGGAAMWAFPKSENLVLPADSSFKILNTWMAQLNAAGKRLDSP